jgi:hypothetical protein
MVARPIWTNHIFFLLYFIQAYDHWFIRLTQNTPFREIQKYLLAT